MNKNERLTRWIFLFFQGCKYVPAKKYFSFCYFKIIIIITIIIIIIYIIFINIFRFIIIFIIFKF